MHAERNGGRDGKLTVSHLREEINNARIPITTKIPSIPFHMIPKASIVFTFIVQTSYIKNPRMIPPATADAT